jgi:hypothetical protein
MNHIIRPTLQLGQLFPSSKNSILVVGSQRSGR